MCQWGIALSLGSNYNSPPDAERERVAHAAVQRALALVAPEREFRAAWARADVELTASRF